VNLDYDRHREYLESEEHRAEDLFENPAPRGRTIPTATIDPSVPSILRHFLDGSRRTYKMADLIVRGRYLPLVAGQVGVAVVARDPERKRLTPMRDFCFFESVLAFPKELATRDDLDSLARRIRQETGQSFVLIHYDVKPDHDPIDLGIASIMYHMAGLELRVVQKLVQERMLNGYCMLVKDGPLQYKNLKGRGFDITQLRNVIGLSSVRSTGFTGRRGMSNTSPLRRCTTTTSRCGKPCTVSSWRVFSGRRTRRPFGKPISPGPRCATVWCGGDGRRRRRSHRRRCASYGGSGPKRPCGRACATRLRLGAPWGRYCRTSSC
jgi:hypothetical protein